MVFCAINNLPAKPALKENKFLPLAVRPVVNEESKLVDSPDVMEKIPDALRNLHITVRGDVFPPTITETRCLVASAHRL